MADGEVLQREAGEDEVAQHPQVGAVEVAGGGVGEDVVAVGRQHPAAGVPATADEVEHQLRAPVRLPRDPVGHLAGEGAGQHELQGRAVGVVAEDADHAEHLAAGVHHPGGGRAQEGQLRVVVLRAAQRHLDVVVQCDRQRRGSDGKLGPAVPWYQQHAVEQQAEAGVAVAAGAHHPGGVDEDDRARRLGVLRPERVEDVLGAVHDRTEVLTVPEEPRRDAVRVDTVVPRAFPGGEHRRAHRDTSAPVGAGEECPPSHLPLDPHRRHPRRIGRRRGRRIPRAAEPGRQPSASRVR
ncbi:MAG TPA: hypothetical protein VNU26_05255 [Mycobacteriales bacterium]|nr:hypothetical protein [Mycobacteriales bacterium]